MKTSTSKIAEISVSYYPNISKKVGITNANDAFQELKEFFPPETIALQEKFIAMYLNRANKILGVYHLSKGGISGTIADVRLILGVALKTASTSIILCHNHPSGNLQPSTADKMLTKKIKEACLFLDITLIDHIIISSDYNYLSFADEGLL